MWGIVIGMLLGILFFSYHINKETEISITNQSDYMNCNSSSVEKATKCLVEFVTPFYNYTVRRGTKPISISELKESGGDCSEWGDLYLMMAQGIGLNSQKISFFGPDKGHRITLVYDDNLTQYCIIDATQYSCFELGDSNDYT